MNKTIHEKLVKYYYHSYAAKRLEAEVEYMLVAFDANELRLQDALDEHYELEEHLNKACALLDRILTEHIQEYRAKQPSWSEVKDKIKGTCGIMEGK